MIFDVNYKSLFLLFIACQELLFATILLRKGIKEGVSSDRWLSLLLVLCAFYMTPWMLGKAGWYAVAGYREFLFFVPFHQYFIMGPVMLFLTKRLVGEPFILKGKMIWHFVPGALYLIYSLVIVITDLIIFDSFYFYEDGMDKDFRPWYQITGLISMVIYAYLSIRKYLFYKKRIYETVSFADEVRYRWLRNFLVSLVLIIVFRGLFIVIFPEIGDWGIKWWYYLIFAILSYYLGLSGLINSIRVSALEIVGRLATPEKDEEESFKGISGADMDHLYEAVNELFRESKIYAQTNLTLAEVAKAVRTNTSILSKVINEKAGMNFNDFVNTYRIAAVKESLENGEMTYKTLVGIAMDQGFNSKSTFIRSFKKKEGMTPSAYYKSIIKS